MLSEKADGKAIKYQQGAANYCKAQGTRISEVQEVTGTSNQTLNNWYHAKPDLFRAVVAGVVALQD